MTEQEYIAVANLARVRAAKAILSDFLPMTPDDAADEKEAMAALTRAEDRLAAAVKIRSES